MPRKKSAHEQQVHEQVEVRRDRLAVHSKSPGKCRGIEQATLLMREHGPEPAQGLCWDARAELRNVALEVGTDEIRAPAQARRIGRGQQTFRKPTAEPQCIELRGTDFAGVERGEFQKTNAPGERFARLLEQIDRR